MSATVNHTKVKSTTTRFTLVQILAMPLPGCVALASNSTSLNLSFLLSKMKKVGAAASGAIVGAHVGKGRARGSLGSKKT